MEGSATATRGLVLSRKCSTELVCVKHIIRGDRYSRAAFYGGNRLYDIHVYEYYMSFPHHDTYMVLEPNSSGHDERLALRHSWCGYR